MNISLLAADIARRIPEMAKDSTVNNEALITRLLTDEEKRTKRRDIAVIEGALKHAGNEIQSSH